MRWNASPKAELHVHLEGTLSCAEARRIGKRNGLDTGHLRPLPSQGLTSFSDFIGPYRAYAAMLRTAEDFEEVAASYLRQVGTWGVRHVEFAIDIRDHESRGATLDTILGGVERAFTSHAEMSGGVIATLDRSTTPAEAEKLAASLPNRGPYLLGVGMAGAEEEHADKRFRRAFAAVAAAGLLVTVHAGQLEFVREAVDDPSVSRIDHGFRVIEDQGLVSAARDRGIHFALAPQTNVLIGPISALSNHPITPMLAAGLSVSLSSDDPAFITSYGDMIERVRTECILDDKTLKVLFDASIENAAMRQERRQQLRAGE